MLKDCWWSIVVNSEKLNSLMPYIVGIMRSFYIMYAFGILKQKISNSFCRGESLVEE